MYDHKKGYLKIPSKGVMFMSPLSVRDIKGFYTNSDATSVMQKATAQFTEPRPKHAHAMHSAALAPLHQPWGSELPWPPGSLRMSRPSFPSLAY